jgi:hypothetical protein
MEFCKICSRELVEACAMKIKVPGLSFVDVVAITVLQEVFYIE